MSVVAALVVFVAASGSWSSWSAASRRSSCRRRQTSSSRWLVGVVGRDHPAAPRDDAREVALGLVVGAGSALVIGYALARSALVERVLSPYLVAAQATPILALAPLIALWFGPGLAGKVVICSLIVFFPVAVATMVGIRSVDAGLLELGRSLAGDAPPDPDHARDPGGPAVDPGRDAGRRHAGGRRRDRRGVGRRRRGLGVLINLARGSLFDIPLMFATLLTIALVGIVLYLIVVLVERRLVGAR